MGDLDDLAAVGTGVVDGPDIALAPAELAGVGEPEPAVGVEHDVVGPGEAPAVAAVVQDVDAAAGEVDPFDPATRPVAAGEAATVVAHVQRAVRSEGRTVGAAVAPGDDL